MKYAESSEKEVQMGLKIKLVENVCVKELDPLDFLPHLSRRLDSNSVELLALGSDISKERGPVLPRDRVTVHTLNGETAGPAPTRMLARTCSHVDIFQAGARRIPLWRRWLSSGKELNGAEGREFPSESAQSYILVNPTVGPHSHTRATQQLLSTPLSNVSEQPRVIGHLRETEMEKKKRKEKQRGAQVLAGKLGS